MSRRRSTQIPPVAPDSEFAHLLNQAGTSNSKEFADKWSETPASSRMAKKRPKREGPPTIDLHGLFRDEAWAQLDAFLDAARKRGERKVIVVTGVGKGVIKQMAMDYLEDAASVGRVRSFRTAMVVDGGFGALEVILR